MIVETIRTKIEQQWNRYANRSYDESGKTNSDAKFSVVFSLILVFGIVIFSPVFGLLASSLGIPITPAVIFAVGIVLGICGLVAISANQVSKALVVSTIVTGTFLIDIPLGKPQYNVSLGMDLWLVQIPLFVLFGYFLFNGKYAFQTLSRAELAFGGFVLWSAIGTILADPVDPQIAFFYVLFVANLWVAFSVARRCLLHKFITLRETCMVFSITIFGHVVFALSQLMNQGLFGLSALGETTRFATNNFVQFGSFNVLIGVFISGLAGGSGYFSVLLVMALPVALAIAVDQDVMPIVFLGGVVGIAVVLRATGKDAARIAGLLAIGLFIILYAYRCWTLSEGAPDFVPSLVGTLFFVTGTLLYPSSVSGTSQPTGDFAAMPDISLPFLTLKSLGIRLQQYVAGLVLTWKNPVFGIGGANFPRTTPFGPRLQIHNQYIALLAETGIPGFFLYSLTIGLVLYTGWRALRSRPDFDLITTGLVCAIIGYLMAIFWVIPLRFTFQVPAWFFLGVLSSKAEVR